MSNADTALYPENESPFGETLTDAPPDSSVPPEGTCDSAGDPSFPDASL